jgi:hypothetical protein
MKWRREIDYHGSRAYAADETARRWFSRGIGGLVNLARSALRKFRRQPEPPIVLFDHGKHTFSLLPLEKAAPPRVKPAACPFPLKAEPPDYRNYRIFP